MKKILAILALAATIGAVLFFAEKANAQIVPAQNQVTTAPYGGLVYGTSTSGTAKLGQLIGNATGNVTLWDGTKWTAVATSSLGITGGVSSVFGRTGAVTAQSGDYNTSLVTELTNLYFTNARAIAATLTGFSASPGTVTSSDSILTAIQKLAGNAASYLTNITGLVTAGTNVTITGSGTSGSPYVINASGSTGGISTTSPWNVGDLAFAASNGSVSTVATGTLTTNATGLQFNSTRALVGGSSILSLASGYTIPLIASTTEWAQAYASTTALTNSYIRGLFSNTATGLTYDSSTGATSLTSGYNIPLTASTTNWNTFYDTPSTRITAGTGLSWAGNTLNASGGTNYFTNSGANTFLSTGTNLQAPVIQATSTTDASTITYRLGIGGITSPDSAFVVGNTATAPVAPQTGTLAHFYSNGNNNARIVGDVYSNATAQGFGFQGRKSRGSIGAPAAPNADDTLAFIGGNGYGTTGFPSASVGAYVIRAESGSFTDSSQPTYLAMLTSPTGTITPTERLRITSAGRVGIGTTSPGSLLSVAGNTYLGGDLIATGTVAFNSLSGILVGNGTSAVTAISGTTCTNQFLRAFTSSGGTCATVQNTDLANSTISGVALGSNLANLTATDSTLTFSGSYNGSTARTVGINLANANTWSASQTFNPAPIFSSLGTPAGAFLAVNASGQVIATTSPSGSSPAGSGSELQYRLNGTTFGALTGSGVSGSSLGIGTTTPVAPLSIASSTYASGNMLFTIGTTTNDQLTVSATSTPLRPTAAAIANSLSSIVTGVRVSIGGFLTTMGKQFDELAINGVLNTGEWMTIPEFSYTTQGSTSDITNISPGYNLDIDTGGTLSDQPVLGAAARLAASSAGQGIRIYAPANMKLATSTPRFEASYRKNGGDADYIGFVTITSATDFTPSNGCYFQATTGSNWTAVTKNPTATTQTLDTGVAYDTANFQGFRINANGQVCEFSIRSTTSQWSTVAVLPATSTSNVNVMAIHAITDTGNTSGDVGYIRAWFRRTLWSN